MEEYQSFSLGSQGELTMGGMSLPALAEKYGTPLYVMDEEKIRHTCRAYQRAMKRNFGDAFHVSYASKALCVKGIYPILKEEGMCADVVSGGELYTALQAGFEVRYAYQQLDCLPEGFTVPDGRVKPWGTAHAILTAEQAIGSAPFAVINADDYYGPQGFKLVYDYLSSHADGDRYAWSMVGFLLGNTVSANGSVSRGVCVTDEHSNLVSVTERTCIEPYDGGIHYTEDGGANWTDLPADTVVSMNLWGFTPGYVAEAKAGFVAFLKENLPVNPLKCEYYLPSVVTAALQRGDADVHVLTSPDKWHGITYREDKPELVAALRRMSEDGLYPKDKLFG